MLLTHLEEVQVALDIVQKQITDYDVGDRPMAPPAALLMKEQELLRLRDSVREAEARKTQTETESAVRSGKWWFQSLALERT